MDEQYVNDFGKFLEHTDEKQVLLAAISEELQKFNVESLLDIGAGNGQLAIPVSQIVKKYTAIEPKEKYVARLKKAGIDVIHSSFPTTMSPNNSYDGILASHVISYQDHDYKAFIDTAWNHLNAQGIFILITHKAEQNEWTNLLDEIGLQKVIYSHEIFEIIKSQLENLGNLEIKKVTSHVTTKDIEDMIQALSFVASDGEISRKNEFLQHQNKLKEILNKRYLVDGVYKFPFHHFMLVTQKMD